jgi:hypothetical protein
MLAAQNLNLPWQLVASSSSKSLLYYRPPHQSAQRWNGNYKHVSRKLADVKKSKKLIIDLTANGVTKTLEKKRMESLQHVLTKAVIWKIFMNDYPDMDIEKDIGDPDYLPDVISMSMDGDPLFWGESGRMKVHKALGLMQRYPRAHIVHCRWGVDIDTFSEPFLDFLAKELEDGRIDDPSSWWHGKFEFASLPLDVWKYIDEETGTILVVKEDIKWKVLDPCQLSRQLTNRNNQGA